MERGILGNSAYPDFRARMAGGLFHRPPVSSILARVYDVSWDGNIQEHPIHLGCPEKVK